jgi:hypothetical protein
MAIDFNTCTMADVIARSYSMHPSLFADALEQVARTHRTASFHTRFDNKAADIATRMAMNCEIMADDIGGGRFKPEALEFGPTIHAFGVACNLQSIPRATANEIAARADKVAA